MKITLSPANVTPVTAEYKGDTFTFDILNFTIMQQVEYEGIVKECIDKKETMSDLHRKQFDFAIENCALKDAVNILPYVDIQKVLKLVDQVNSSVDEKKS
jgi:hypothetical protein